MNEVIEMVTIGVGKWSDTTYKIAILGGEATPLIHIYKNDGEEFDLGISLIDILCKDEINIVCLSGNGTELEEIKAGFRNFLFRPCVNRSFTDNLDRATYEWNRETDFVTTEQEGKNLLAQYLAQNNLTPLAKYKKYLTDYAD